MKESFSDVTFKIDRDYCRSGDITPRSEYRPRAARKSLPPKNGSVSASYRIRSRAALNTGTLNGGLRRWNLGYECFTERRDFRRTTVLPPHLSPIAMICTRRRRRRVSNHYPLITRPADTAIKTLLRDLKARVYVCAWSHRQYSSASVRLGLDTRSSVPSRRRLRYALSPSSQQLQDKGPREIRAVRRDLQSGGG